MCFTASGHLSELGQVDRSDKLVHLTPPPLPQIRAADPAHPHIPHLALMRPIPQMRTRKQRPACPAYGLRLECRRPDCGVRAGSVAAFRGERARLRPPRAPLDRGSPPPGCTESLDTSSICTDARTHAATDKRATPVGTHGADTQPCVSRLP